MYVLITSVVLMFLNLYTASTIRNLIFEAKRVSMEDKVQLAAAAFSELNVLGTANAEQAMSQLGSLNVTRVLVTDAGGTVLFDSIEDAPAVGKLALLPEIVQALEGNDVSYCAYQNGILESRAAIPIVYYSNLVGSVYLMEYDLDQGALISTLQNNIFRISVVLELAVILFSLAFSQAFSRRMRQILASIRIIREGDYFHKMKLGGKDELSVLASEFNELTDRLQTSEQRRRQFVSDASHELKTPLTSIKLLSDSILQNEMEIETVREFVDDIGSEADRLTRMSEKLLSLTKMDAGKGDDREIADVGQTVEKVLKMLAPLAKLQQVTLHNKAPLGATVLIVEDDLYQIIFNLVENGIKYNRSGGALTVALRREQDDFILTVADTGVGIPEESVPYIFDRFYRVDKARSRQAGGSGLGLSIVHDMVERNYGTIAVSPGEDGGTCFTVVFPAFDLFEEETE